MGQCLNEATPEEERTLGWMSQQRTKAKKSSEILTGSPGEDINNFN